MANKTSIRFFEDVPVRAVWDDESAKWWFCAMDIAEALTKTTNPRVYWATVKRRNPQLIAICKQLKLKAKDGKYYNTDVLDEQNSLVGEGIHCRPSGNGHTVLYPGEEMLTQ